MKKRVITGMMTASVIVSLAGCGAGQKETVESTAPATMTETVAASQAETAEVTETETTVHSKVSFLFLDATKTAPTSCYGNWGGFILLMKFYVCSLKRSRNYLRGDLIAT